MNNVNKPNNHVPQGWVFEKLGKYADYKKGKKPETLSQQASGKYKFPYVDIKAFEKGVIANYTDGENCVICSDNDFLMVWDGSRSGYVGKGIKGVLGSTLMKINLPALCNDFAFYFLQSKYLEINSRAKGTGTPHVDPDLLWKYLLPIPPLSEQYRIVEKIEELFSDLDKGIESLKTTQQQLKIYRQAVLKWAFEGKLTAKWREEKKHMGELKSAEELLVQIKAEREKRDRTQLQEWHEAVKTWEANGKQGKKPGKPNKNKEVKALSEVEITKLPELPEGWNWIHLEEILNKIEAGKSFRCEERTPSLQQVGVAKVSAVTWGEYNELESKTCLDKSKIEARFLIREGDFLFSRANTVELVGACVIVKKTNLQIMLSDKTLRFLFSDSKFKKYVLYFLKSRLGRSEIERLATGNQESMRNIGQDRIQSIKTPLPSFEEQNQIVEEIEFRLSICDRLEATITENLQRAEALRQSILKQAFEGKLVPQDPNDEPAEQLIERIRQEKLNSKNGKQLELKI